MQRISTGGAESNLLDYCLDRDLTMCGLSNPRSHQTTVNRNLSCNLLLKRIFRSRMQVGALSDVAIYWFGLEKSIAIKNFHTYPYNNFSIKFVRKSK